MTRARSQITLTALLGLMAWAALASAAGASPTAGGPRWGKPVRADWGLHVRHVRALSCPSEKFCAAVDEAGRVVFYRGASWTKPVPVDAALKGDDVLLGISCTYRGFCVTFNAQGDVFIYDGQHWRGPSSLWSAGIYDAGAVACPASNFCVLENSHRVYMYRSGHWTAGPHLRAAGVSCSSSSFCAVTSVSGTSSFASLYRTEWGPARAVAHGAAIHSISCASLRFCVAVGARLAGGHANGGGTAVTYHGRFWSHPQAIKSALTGPTSVSCASSTFCAAVDGAGNALMYRGHAWSPANPIDPQAKGRPVWISCPSSSFCMAIDSWGYATRYH